MADMADPYDDATVKQQILLQDAENGDVQAPSDLRDEVDSHFSTVLMAQHH